MKKSLLFLIAAVCLVGALLPMNAQAASKAKYHFKKIDKSKTYKGKTHSIEDEESYTRVVLEGKSSAVKKINKTLAKECKKVVKKMPVGYAEGSVDNVGYDAHFMNVYESKVTYNAHNVISIMVTYNWFQGGVSDYGCNCYTFSLKTGKRLKLTDVTGASNKSLTKKIKKKLKKKYGPNAFMQESFDKISADKCDFYLKPGKKAVVCFDKYEISYGAAGAFDITVPSKYK